MDFMEVIRLMREENKKFKRAYWHKTVEPLSYGSNIATLNFIDIEADDWEIVDEMKDWNLSEETINWIRDETTQETKTGRFYTQENVKKCRDLILQDLYKMNFNHSMSEKNILDVINKRFGDL